MMLRKPCRNCMTWKIVIVIMILGKSWKSHDLKDRDNENDDDGGQTLWKSHDLKVMIMVIMNYRESDDDGGQTLWKSHDLKDSVELIVMIWIARLDIFLSTKKYRLGRQQLSEYTAYCPDICVNQSHIKISVSTNHRKLRQSKYIQSGYSQLSKCIAQWYWSLLNCFHTNLK